MADKGISRQSRQANERVAQGRCARCGIIRKAEKGATSRLCGKCAEKAREEWKRRKKTAKSRKPRLTRSMADSLRSLAALGETQAPLEPEKNQKHLYQASSWIFRLCDWYDATHLRKSDDVND